MSSTQSMNMKEASDKWAEPERPTPPFVWHKASTTSSRPEQNQKHIKL